VLRIVTEAAPESGTITVGGAATGAGAALVV
jgi:hypothetical protein